MDLNRNYDKISLGGKIYGEKGEHTFWPALEES